MTQEAYQAAARYWDERDAKGVKMDRAALLAAVEDYLQANDTCALATGGGACIRCTPLEYRYRDGCFWIFSEGGRKFLGLAQSAQVSLAVFDEYQSFGTLHSVQVTGTAELVEPFSPRYEAAAEARKLPLDALRKLAHPMHLICVKPSRMDVLCADFKKQGFDSRQSLTF